MKLKLNDKVIIITGKEKGKTGKIIRVITKHSKVVVSGINMRTKHIKKTPLRAGERIKYEAPLNASNVMILDPKENKPTRIGYRILDNGKKERYAKLSGTSLDAKVASVKNKAAKQKAAEPESTTEETQSAPKKATKKNKKIIKV